VRSEGFMSMKNTLTPAGIEPATFRFVAPPFPSTTLNFIIRYPNTENTTTSQNFLFRQKFVPHPFDNRKTRSFFRPILIYSATVSLNELNSILFFYVPFIPQSCSNNSKKSPTLEKLFVTVPLTL